MQLIRKWLKAYWTIWSYLLFGGLTTLINLVDRKSVV